MPPSSEKRLSEDPIIQFGKYKGLNYSELPLDYLQWMKREIKSPEKTVIQINFELERRKTNVPVKISNSKEPWNDPSTHYQWTDRNGKVHSIPNDVSLAGKETEVAPF